MPRCLQTVADNCLLVRLSTLLSTPPVYRRALGPRHIKPVGGQTRSYLCPRPIAPQPFIMPRFRFPTFPSSERPGPWHPLSRARLPFGPAGCTRAQTLGLCPRSISETPGFCHGTHSRHSSPAVSAGWTWGAAQPPPQTQSRSTTITANRSRLAWSGTPRAKTFSKNWPPPKDCRAVEP